MKHALASLAAVVCALSAAPLAGQTQPPPGEPPPAAAAPAADPETLEALARAQERFEAGDLAGAIASLEPLRHRPQPSLPALSLLGAFYVEVGRHADALALLAPLAEAPDANPAVLYNASRAAAAAGQPDAARRFLERAAAIVPVSPAGRDLGLALLREGRDAEAFALLRPWAVYRPEDLETVVGASLLALRLGRSAEAETLLEGAPAGDPNVVLLRAKLLLGKGDPRGAVALLEPLKERHPPAIAADFRRVLADAYLAAGQTAEAVALLERADLADPAVVLLLAEAHYQRGETDRALVLLEPLAAPIRDRRVPPKREDARQLDGALARAYGRVLVAAGRAAEAVPVLARAVELRPQDLEAWQSYGQALASTGRRDEAAAALQRFSELTEAAKTAGAGAAAGGSPVPENPRLREALHLLAIGHREKALEIARAEMAASAQDLWPRVLVVRILLLMNEPAEALTVAQETLRLAPDHPDAVYQRGAVQMALLNREEAERDFRRALELAPEHVAAMNDLAVLLMLRGADAEARALLERVLALRPDDLMASRNLQKLKERAAGG